MILITILKGKKKNHIILTWTKPQNTGLYIKDGGNTTFGAINDRGLNIYKYRIYIDYSENSVTKNRIFDISVSQYNDTPLTMDVYDGDIDVNGKNILITKSTDYSIKISAFNWLYTNDEDEGDISSPITIDGIDTIPKTILDIDRELTDIYKPTLAINDSSKYVNKGKILNNYNNPSSVTNISTDIYDLSNTQTFTTTSVGDVLMNFKYPEPSTNTFMKIQGYILDVTTDSIINSYSNTIDISSGTSNNMIDISANNRTMFEVKLGTSGIGDIFNSTPYNDNHNYVTNQDEWYMVDTLQVDICRNSFKLHEDEILGKNVTFGISFEYLSVSNSDNKIIAYDLITDKYFDNISKPADITDTVTETFTPIYVTGIPNIYVPNQTSTFDISGTINNYSRYYVVDDIIASVLDDDGVEYNNELTYGVTDSQIVFKSNWSSNKQFTFNYEAIGTLKSISTNSKDISLYIKVKNIKGEKIYNAEQKFIYDKSNYDIISQTQNSNLNELYDYRVNTDLSSKDPILLFTPTDFDPFIYNKDKNSFQYENLPLFNSNYGSSHKTLSDLNNQLIFYNGCFRSPKNFCKTNVFGTTSVNYKFIDNIFNHYTSESGVVVDTTSYIDFTQTRFANQYKWQIFRYNINILEYIGLKKFLVCSLEDTNITLTQMGKNTTTHTGITIASDVEIWFKIEYTVSSLSSVGGSKWMKLSGYTVDDSAAYQIQRTGFGTTNKNYGWKDNLILSNESGWENGNLGESTQYNDGIGRKIIIGNQNFPILHSGQSLRLYFCVGIKNNIDAYLGKIRVHKFIS